MYQYPDPSAALLDSQSVKTTAEGHGFVATFTNLTTHEHLAADKVRTYRREADDYGATHISINPFFSQAHP